MNASTSESRIATAIVIPNDLKMMPVVPDVNATMKT
jgi:hypothetical protein